MSTRMEDRLAAALQARAEQVGPEHLRPLEVPHAPAPSWKPWVAGLAAAAAVAAVLIPVELRGGDDSRPVPPATSTSPSPSPTQVDALPFVETSRARGDVDGDGRPDLVRTSEDGVVRVDFADGPRVESKQPSGAGVDGLASLDEGPSPGLAIVLGIDSGDERPVRVLRWVDGTLERVEPADGTWLGTRAGQTTWVEEHELWTGSFEGTFGDAPVRVATSYWTLQDGRLRSTDAVERCWQPSAEQPHPVSCTSEGPDAGFGARAGLPRLFPAVEQVLVHQRFRWEGAQLADYAQLQGELDPAGGHVEAGQVELVVVSGGKEYRAPIPAGESPELVPRELSGIDGDTPVLLVRQSGGDSGSLRVFSIRDDGKLHEVEPVGGVHLGSGYVDSNEGAGEQRTWISQSGQLFTALSLDPGTKRHKLWRWNDQMGDTITPTYLGEVCIDWETDDYGRCP